MKKFILPIALISLSLNAFAQIENGGFEDWVKLSLFQHPNVGETTMSSNYETYFADGSLNVNKVEANDGFALRIENKSVNGTVVPGYFIYGQVPLSGESGLLFPEGLPFEDGAVTGISMDMNYNIPQGEQGTVIVQFKSNGTPVGPGNHSTGTFVFPFSGVQDWSNVEFDFGGELGVEVDQCVIAITSGDMIENDIPYSPEAFVEIDNIQFLNSQEIIPGATFESWVYVTPIFYPAMSTVDLHPFEMACVKSEYNSEGFFSMELRTLDRDGFIEPGYLLMGNKEETDIVPNIAVDMDKTMLSFMYRYLAQDDVAEAVITFYEEGDGIYLPVFEKTIGLAPNGGFEYVEYDFAADLEEMFATPTHMAIEFKSSSSSEDNTPQAGSTLFIDDVKVSGALSIFTAFKNPIQTNVLAYPNPTIGRVLFDFGTNRAGYYRVYNSQGTQVAIREFTSTRRLVHDMSNMPSGKYLFRFFHNAGIQSVSVLKL